MWVQQFNINGLYDLLKMKNLLWFKQETTDSPYATTSHLLIHNKPHYQSSLSANFVIISYLLACL